MGTEPTISFSELRRRIQVLGFVSTRQKGSHIRYVHPDGRRTTIPDHGSKDVPKGLLSKIIKIDLGMDISDFLSLSR